jgi:hypothetical protein
MLEIGFVLKLHSNTVPVVPPSTGNVPRKCLNFIPGNAQEFLQRGTRLVVSASACIARR